MPRQTVIVDTVGFIRKLPHDLVASFRSTMEEAVSADLVLHVIDVSHPQFEDQRTIAADVLRDLGVDSDRVIEVYNKADRGENIDVRRRGAVTISALTGYGIDRLAGAIRQRELAGGEVMHLDVPHSESRLLAQLFEVAQIVDKRVDDAATHITAWVPRDAMSKFANFEASDLLGTARVS
jgi:GTP-binding protein HflX